MTDNLPPIFSELPQEEQDRMVGEEVRGVKFQAWDRHAREWIDRHGPRGIFFSDSIYRRKPAEPEPVKPREWAARVGYSGEYLFPEMSCYHHLEKVTVREVLPNEPDILAAADKMADRYVKIWSQYCKGFGEVPGSVEEYRAARAGHPVEKMVPWSEVQRLITAGNGICREIALLRKGKDTLYLDSFILVRDAMIKEMEGWDEY